MFPVFVFCSNTCMKNTENKKNIIIFVMNLPEGSLEAVRRYEKESGEKYRIMLLWDSRVKDVRRLQDTPGLDLFVSCDFSKPHKIAQELLPYQDQLLAITCRSEMSMARFAQVIPHVPYLRTPTPESLIWASDKYEMRRRMKLYDPSITPEFTLVHDATKKELDRVVRKIGFPLIVKPTNLASSMFVTICYHEEELQKTLRSMFRRLRVAYKKDTRLEQPRIIAEQYMDGDLYSIDSYVGSRGGVTHCPLVKQVTAKKLARDDFYNYIQSTPVNFKPTTIAKAEEVVEKAIHALGLRSTITHTEVIKLDDEWKVVEVGARMGGFRHVLHQLSCDINHTMNDILVRIPGKVQVPKKCKGFAATLKWYAGKEGIIEEMRGIKKVEQLESFHKIVMNKKLGDRAVFARNGGRSIFNLFLYNQERAKLLADIRRVEQSVRVRVKDRRKKSPSVVTKGKKSSQSKKVRT